MPTFLPACPFSPSSKFIVYTRSFENLDPMEAQEYRFILFWPSFKCSHKQFTPKQKRLKSGNVANFGGQ